MTEKQESEQIIKNNNKKDSLSENKIEFWDENLAMLFQKLNKYLPEDFPLIEIHDAEKEIFGYSSTLDKVGFKIREDGTFVMDPLDKNEVQRKVQSGNDLRILLSNYVNDSDKRNFKFNIFGLPFKLDVKEFIARYAPKLKWYQMYEIMEVTKIKPGTWTRYIRDNLERFIPDGPLEEFKLAVYKLAMKHKSDKAFEFDKYLPQLNVSVKQFKDWCKKGLLKKCVILNYKKNVFYSDF